MNNPVIYFVAAAVASMGGVLYLSKDNWSGKNAPPNAIVQKSERDAAIGNKPEAQPEAKPEKQAALDPSATAEPPKQEVSKATPEKPDEKAEQPKSNKPSFDIVRVEETGDAVIAGRAVPDSDVELKLDGRVVGKAKANERGEWVILPNAPLPAGGHVLTVESSKDKKTLTSQQSVTVAVPENGSGKPLIVLNQPSAPSKVLQKPAAPKVAVAEPKPEPKPEPPKAVEADKPASSDEPQVAKVEPAPAEAEKPAAEKPKEEKLASVEPTEKPEKVDPAPEAPKGPAVAMTIDALDYNDRGNIVFSGKAQPGANIRIYVDNNHVADARADENGAWVYRGRSEIKPGQHALRLDQITQSGGVTQRIGMPFVRANPQDIAKLFGLKKLKPEDKPEPKTEIAAAEPPKPDTAAESEAETANKPKVEDTAEKVVEAQEPVEEKKPAPEPQIVAGTPEPGANLPAKIELRKSDPQSEIASASNAPDSDLPASIELVVPKSVAEAASQPVGAEANLPAKIEPINPSPQLEVTEDVSQQAKPKAQAQVALNTRGNIPAIEPETEQPKSETEQPKSVESEPQDPAAPATENVETEAVPEPVAPEKETARTETQPEPVAPKADKAPAQPAPASVEPEKLAKAETDVQPQPVVPRQDKQVAAVEPSAPPKAEPAPEPVPGRVIVQPGNNLWNISRVIYGRGIEYSVIFQANKNQIRNPHRIYPGQIFATPGAAAPVRISPDWRKPLDEIKAREAAAEKAE